MWKKKKKKKKNTQKKTKKKKKKNHKKTQKKTNNNNKKTDRYSGSPKNICRDRAYMKQLHEVLTTYWNGSSAMKYLAKDSLIFLSGIFTLLHADVSVNKQDMQKMSCQNALTFTTLCASSADNKLMIYFLFFSENRLSHFMQIVS